MLGNGKKTAERREQDRKKRGGRKYGQAKLKHSRAGILSCICAAAAAAILASCIFYAYLTRGNAPGIVGGFSILSFVLAGAGIRLAVRGFREREKNTVLCKIGLPAGGIVIVLFLAIFIGGLGG